MEQKAWIIDEKTAKQYLTVEDAIDCVEKTWKWYGEGRVIMPNKITTDMSELGVAGWFNSMPAYIGPMDVAGIKVVGGYDGNKALGQRPDHRLEDRHPARADLRRPYQ